MPYFEGYNKFGMPVNILQYDDSELKVVEEAVREVASHASSLPYRAADAVTNAIGYWGMYSGGLTMAVGVATTGAGAVSGNVPLVGQGAIVTGLGYLDYKAGRWLVDLL